MVNIHFCQDRSRYRKPNIILDHNGNNIRSEKQIWRKAVNVPVLVLFR